MSFQGFTTLYAAYTVLKAPGKTHGALGLASVLTALIFLSCHEVYAAPTWGVHDNIYQYALDPVNNSNKFVGAMTNFGQYERAIICFFAGLVICAAADAGIVLTIADEETATTSVATPVSDVPLADV